eukprot:3718355-Pleurochrysis_carterae.AAC.1
MPIMHATRVQGQKGGVALPIAVRALAYGQLARLTPPRAVGQNIAAVVRCVAPWLRCTEATYDTVLKLRSEMTVLGEMLAARRVAELKRVLSFGFDETSKFQIGTLSTNVQGEAADGRIVNIVLRGAFVIAAGTAEHVVEAIENKLFSRGRKLLARWQAKFLSRQADGAAAWTGPEPSALALERLRGSLIMSDTCNAARATKRRLAA